MTNNEQHNLGSIVKGTIEDLKLSAQEWSGPLGRVLLGYVPFKAFTNAYLLYDPETLLLASLTLGIMGHSFIKAISFLREEITPTNPDLSLKGVLLGTTDRLLPIIGVGMGVVSGLQHL